jgi:hypothetical protein
VCSERIFPANGFELSARDYLLDVEDRLIALMCLLCRTPSIKIVGIHLCMNTVVRIRSVGIHLHIHTNEHLGRMVDELIACPVLADPITESLNSRDPTVTSPQYLAGWSRERGFAVSNAEEKKAMLKMEAARERKTKSEFESTLDEELESSCGKMATAKTRAERLRRALTEQASERLADGMAGKIEVWPARNRVIHIRRGILLTCGRGLGRHVRRALGVPFDQHPRSNGMCEGIHEDL